MPDRQKCSLILKKMVCIEYQEKLELEMKVICRVANTEAEREHAFQVRNHVFVREQGLFQATDIDEFDTDAIPIIAEIDKKIVGTVRVYQAGRDLWMGGRLAVLKEYRKGRVGSVLVREAVKTVKSKGARRFLAFIQLRNVRYFRGLGWKPEGPILLHHGVFHQKMAADLNGD
jgi:putative N-acetyltransferase (TIGR04045 family)